MAKIYGLFGAMTGKVADAVMVVRNGEQIVRKYQPMVSNPSTDAQVEARAKLKLMSQLAAVMAPVIAIPRDGNVSSRNNFVKYNYKAAGYSNLMASVDLSAITLTKSVVAMPSIQAEATTESIRAYITSAGRVGVLDVSRIVYAMFVKQTDETLRYVGSAVANEAGVDNNWPVSLPLTTESVVIYAYGVRDNNESARVAFGNLEVESAESVAKLIVSRSVKESDITLTETVAWQGIAQ